MARLLWQMLYFPMAVIWLTLCAVQVVCMWPVRGLDWVLAQLAPGILLVAWRADGGEGNPPDDDV